MIRSQTARHAVHPALLAADADEVEHGRGAVALLQQRAQELRALRKTDGVVAGRQIRRVFDGSAGDGDLLTDRHQESVFGIFCSVVSDLQRENANARERCLYVLLYFTKG
jgi:hypothetical protein